MTRSNPFMISSFFLTLTGHLAAAELVEIGANLEARGISADGRHVVGSTAEAAFADRRAFLWSRETGVQILGTLAGSGSVARGGSVDGSIVVGESTGNSGNAQAFIWTEDSGMMGVGVPSGFDGSFAVATSNDGMTIAGTAFTDGPTFSDRTSQPIRWTPQNGPLSLGLPNGMSRAEASDISADGSVIIGHGLGTGNITQSFLWNAAHGFQDLGPLPPGWDSITAILVSADGSTVVGTDINIGRMFRWNRQEGIQVIPPLATIRDRGRPGGVSADGSVIIGTVDGGPALGDGVAFVWDEQRGTRNLRDVLIAEHGFDGQELAVLEQLSSAPLLSSDATTIVGWNEIVTGRRDSWAIYLDKPLVSLGLPGDYNNNGTVEQADLDLVLLHWGADATAVPATWTNNLPTGTIDQDELDGVLLNWGNTTSAAITSAAVPEPSGVLLIGLLAVGALVHHGVGSLFSRRARCWSGAKLNEASGLTR